MEQFGAFLQRVLNKRQPSVVPLATDIGDRAQEPKTSTQERLLELLAEEQQAARELLSHPELVSLKVEPRDKTQQAFLDFAFEEMRTFDGNKQSSLIVLKAYLLSRVAQDKKVYTNEEASLEESDRFNESHLLRMLLLQTARQDPSQFGTVGRQVQEALIPKYSPYINLSTQLGRLESAWIDRESEVGKPWGKTENSSIFQKFQDGRPIVYCLKTGLGDVALSLPVFKTLVETIIACGFGNKFYILSGQKQVTFIKNALGDLAKGIIFKIAENGQENEAVRQCLEEGNDMRQDGTDPQTGILLGFTVKDEFLHVDQLSENVTYLKVSPPIDPIFAEESEQRHSFSRSLLLELSGEFKRLLYNPREIVDTTSIARAFHEYLEQYRRDHQDVINEMEEKKKIVGGKYIFLCGKGSQPTKRLTPSGCLEIIKEFKDTGVGFVYMDPGDKKGPNELSEIKSLFEANNIPFVVIEQQKEFEPTFLWMEDAVATIGVDTFLTHVAEYFGYPVLNIFLDSDANLWRLDDRVIAVEHPLASLLREEHLTYFPGISEKMILNLELYPTDKPSEHAHPIVKTVQEKFFENLREKLRELRKRVVPDQ